MQIVREEGLDFLWPILAEVTARRVRERMFGDLAAETAFIDNQGVILGASSNAVRFAEELRHAT